MASGSPTAAPTAPAPGRTRRFGRWALDRVRRRAARVGDRSLSRGRRMRLALSGLLALGATLGALAVVLVGLYALVLLPFTPGVGALRKARELHPAVVLAADGGELTRFARNGREWVPLEEVAEPVVDALLATEDRRFYTHPGLDARRTVGAALHTLMGDREGGSTITQQLARNLFPEEIGRSASITRKLKEALTALKIEWVYEKDEILEIYLNTVPFLYNAYGIEMAAQTYFSTSASDLDARQAATLVAMLKGTSYYNPVRNPERALERRNLVLRLMARDGHLTPAEADALAEEPLGLRFERIRPQRSRAAHFTEHVRRWLVDWADRNGYNAYGDGLVVHTTLDLDLQRRASEAVAEVGDELQAVADVEWGRPSAEGLGTTPAPYVRRQGGVEAFGHFWDTRRDLVERFVRASPAFREAVAAGNAEDDVLDSLGADEAFLDALRNEKTRLDVGVLAIEPQTGFVRAWVGSRNFTRTPFDHVADARRQPGSTFKPFVYARALQEGYEPDDVLPDDTVSIPLENGTVWRPTNQDGVTGEPTTLRDALARSKNTVTARLVEDVGARDVARLARAMGVNRSPLRPVPSLALGTSEVSLLELTSAYATIADGGTYREPVFVTKVEDREGNVLATFGPEGREVLDADTDALLLDMMRGVVDGGTGQGVRSRYGLRGDLAGKTGTSQGGADGWFMLMHPDLVAGAWVGFDDPRVTFRSSYWGQGAHNALLVVGDFFRASLGAGLLDADAAFPPPPEAPPGGPFWLRLARHVGDLFLPEGEAGPVEGEVSEERPESPPRPPRPRPGDDLEGLAREVFRDAVREAERATGRPLDPDEVERFMRDALRQAEDRAQDVERWQQEAEGLQEDWAGEAERIEENAERLREEAERAQEEIEQEAADGARRMREAWWRDGGAPPSGSDGAQE